MTESQFGQMMNWLTAEGWNPTVNVSAMGWCLTIGEEGTPIRHFWGPPPERAVRDAYLWAGGPTPLEDPS